MSGHEPSPHRARLTVLELRLPKRSCRDVLAHLTLKYELAQLSHATSQGNGVGVILCEVNLSWFVENPFWLEVLEWRHIFWVKRAIVTHIPVFLSSLLLVAVHLVPLLELI